MYIYTYSHLLNDIDKKHTEASGILIIPSVGLLLIHNFPDYSYS